jgi:hypothetical protein
MIDDLTRVKAWKNINEGLLHQDELKVEYGRLLLGRTYLVDSIIERFRITPNREDFLRANIQRLWQRMGELLRD